MEKLKNLFQLTFGATVFKRYRSNTNFWFRQNNLGCLFTAILYPTILALIFHWFADYPAVKDNLLYRNVVFFSVVSFVFTYKITASVVRYFKTKIPVWVKVNLQPVGTPWFWADIFFFFLSLTPQSKVERYQPMTVQEITLHKKQQLARIIYYTFLESIAIGIYNYHNLI